MKKYNWKKNEVAYCTECSPEKKKIRRTWHNFFGHGLKEHWHKSDTPDLFKKKSNKPFVFFQHKHNAQTGHRFYRGIHFNTSGKHWELPSKNIFKRCYWGFMDWGYHKGYFHFITPDGMKSRPRDFRLGKEKRFNG